MAEVTTHTVLYEVARERIAQDKKWGPQHHTPGDWAAILGEEYGEACQEMLRVTFGGKDPEDLVMELVQVAAVAVAIVEDIRNGKAQVPSCCTREDSC